VVTDIADAFCSIFSKNAQLSDDEEEEDDETPGALEVQDILPVKQVKRRVSVSAESLDPQKVRILRSLAPLK